mmetsp:Transcript_77682/g.218007  ORF Transcript_77682/g.218007 Transcript_77682/m.218007 type:complete len:288 (-) Transcript_77682:103-966(-)
MKSRANFRLLDAKPCTQKASRRNPPPDWNSRQGTARVAKGQSLRMPRTRSGSRARRRPPSGGRRGRPRGGPAAGRRWRAPRRGRWAWLPRRVPGRGRSCLQRCSRRGCICNSGSNCAPSGSKPRTTPLRHGHPHGNSPPSLHTIPPAPTARPRRRHLRRAPRPQSRGPSPGSARPRPAGRRSAGARGHGVRRADPKMPRAAPAASPPGQRPSASPRPRATPRGPLLRIGRGRRAEDLPPSVGPPPRAAAPPRAPAPRAEAPGWPRGIGPGPRSCARRRAIGQGPHPA